MAEQKTVREFLNGPAGKVVAILFAAAVIGVAGYSVWGYAHRDAAVAAVGSPLFVDAETGQSFHVTLEPGMSMPVKSPFTGKLDGYPAELCFWTKDGKSKTDPTPVLLNEMVGKPGPTFCPDCGRLVVHHNPGPSEARHVPPTKEEYEASHSH